MNKIYLLIISLFLLFSCNSVENKVVEKKEPISKKSSSTKEEMSEGRDLDEIKKQGILKVLTVHSPSSYFLYKGKSMGFEFELLENFAEEIGVKLKVIKVRDINEIIPMLKNGEGDIIGHGLAVTNSRKEEIAFTDSYNIIYQVLVQRKPHKWWQMRTHNVDKKLIKDVTQLLGDTVSIRRESSYYERIKNLEKELGDTIYVNFIDGSYSTEEIIKMVADGDIKYTIADNNIAQINKSYYSDLDIDTKISLSQRVAWAVRKDSPKLKEAINEWLRKIKKNGFYNIIYSKYFKNSHQFKKRMKSDYFSIKETGKIGQYDDIIKKYSKEINWDWRLVSSIIYQESRFDHNVKSWVGASGLMQIMPETAEELGMKNKSEEESIRIGTKYLDIIYQKFDEIPDSIQRIKLTLAAYNCGYGHILDAQRIAKYLGKDPNSWDNGVGEALLKLSNPKYYNREEIRHGYVRGIEPYNYVNEIFERYETYKDLIE